VLHWEFGAVSPGPNVLQFIVGLLGGHKMGKVFGLSAEGWGQFTGPVLGSKTQNVS
jgi:hypothetical protein